MIIVVGLDKSITKVEMKHNVEDYKICFWFKHNIIFAFSGSRMRSGIFSSQQCSNLKKVPNQPIWKGDNFAIIATWPCMYYQFHFYFTFYCGPSYHLTIFGIYFIDQTCCPLQNTYVPSSSLLMVSLSLLLSGPTVSNHKHTDKPKFRAKSSIRPTPRSSTLMRPTASQLAKQNNARWLSEHVNLGTFLLVNLILFT